MKEICQGDAPHHQTPTVERRNQTIEGGHRVRVAGEKNVSQRLGRSQQLADRPLGGVVLLVLVFLALFGQLLRVARDELQALGRPLGQLGALGEDLLGPLGQLHLAVLAGPARERAAERRHILVQATPPGAHVLLHRAQPTPGQEGTGSAGARRLAEELVEALEHLDRSDFGGEDLVGDAGQLVGLVHDDVGHVRIVRRPAKQQIVIGDHQLRLGQGLALCAEGTVAFVAALLPGALIGTRRHRTAAQIAQCRKAEQQRAGKSSHFPGAARPSARRQRRIGHPVLDEHARFAPFGLDGLEATAAHVVRAALDREGAKLRIAQHGRRGRDVLAQQLVLKELGLGRDDDRVVDPAGCALHGERNHRRQVRQRLSHARTALEQERAALVEHARKLAGHADLLLAHPVAGEVAAASLRVGQHGGDRVGVEGDGLLPPVGNRHELRRLVGTRGKGGPLQQLEPRDLGHVALERIARSDVAPLPGPGADGRSRHDPQRVECVRESAVTLLGVQHVARERL